MFPPNADLSQLLNSPLVDDLLQARNDAAPLSIPSAPPGVSMPTTGLPASAQQGASPDRSTKTQQIIDLVVPLFALGQALGGSAQSGGAMLHGYHAGQALDEQRRQHAAQFAIQRQQEARLEAEQARIARAQEAAQIAHQQQVEEQRQRAVVSMITDAQRQARTLTTKADHDQFVSTIDAMASERLGMRPGTIVNAVPFVPPPMRDRAQKALDRIRKAAPDGRLAMVADAGQGRPDPHKGTPTQPLEQASVSFDVDGDGTDEVIPFRKLEELAGEAFYTADGQRLAANQPATVATFGETFPQARGTVFANKSLPVTAKGQPDYGKALRDLHALNGGSASTPTERRQSRTDAQQQARDRLYAAVLEGGDEKALAGQFGGVFSAIGLSYRAELAKIRQRIYTTGSQGLSPEDRELSTPEDVLTRGRTILGGGSPSGAVVTPPVPAPSGRGRGGRPVTPPTPGQDWPTTTASNDYLVLRDKAQAVLDAEAQRRGLPAGSVTEEQIQTFLKNPENRKRLKR